MHHDRRGPRPVTVPATAAPASAPLITAPCRLVGWSLAAGAVFGTQPAEARVVSPGAGAAIVTLLIPTGSWSIAWTVQLDGAAAAADENNFQLFAGLVAADTSVNAGAAGTYPQAPVLSLVTAATLLLSVKTIGAGTVGVGYTADILATPSSAGTGQINDSGQPLAFVGAPPGGTDTRHLGKHGLYVSTSLALQVNSGTLQGVIWIDDFDAHLAS